MRPLEHRNSGVVGDGFPEGSVTASVTGDGTPIPFAPSASDLDRGDVLAGRFQIEALIGTGGSGRVLRAFDRESRMLVALKILRQELAGEAVWAERFARELRVGRAISHPNVCRVFDIGEADGHRFLSMELATGGSLRADVPKVDAWQAARRDRPARAWAEKVSDARAIVAGVAALHQEGIVHRDLKPENILRMHDGRLVVTDFGLATDPGSGPGTTIMVGTPSYMAPEVVMGEPATLRSDVWGLGVVLHEIFFGLRPQWKVLGRGYRRFVRPEAARTNVELAVANLCGRCADDDPQSRPETATEVGRELERALRGKRVLSRHLRRRITWGATAIAAVTGLLVVKAHFANRAEASLSQAAAAKDEAVVVPTGRPADWSENSTTLAAFPGRLHCFQVIDHGRRSRVVWGAPRRAEDIDVKTGLRTPSELLAETYRDGCPSLSPAGDKLLFEETSDAGTRIMFASSPTGAGAKQLTRGSGPVWLPNGQEFVYALDTRHAAMFSLPTREMTLVTDESDRPRLLGDYAVDPSGSRMAVLYATDDVNNLLVVHSLPGLEVLSRVPLRSTAGRLQFGERGDVLLSGDRIDGVSRIAPEDFGHPVLHNVGRMPDWDIRDVTFTGGDILVTARQLNNDLWVERGGEREPLTHDGVSVHGSLSKQGALLLQRRTKAGAFVIFLRLPDGSERQVSAGPVDATPTFLPDGNTWVYAKLDAGQLIKCHIADQSCAPILTDKLVPAYPSGDPSGSQIAYVTLMNGARVRVASADGGQARDFGPASDKCAPVWTTSRRLWIATPTDGQDLLWAEVDADTGKHAGPTRKVAVPPGQDCAVPTDLELSRQTEPTARIVSVRQENARMVRLSVRGAI